MVQPESGAVTDLAVTYLQLSTLGLATITVGDTLEAGIIGHGDSRASLWMNVCAVGVNVALDPFSSSVGASPSPRHGGPSPRLHCRCRGGLALGGWLVACGRNGWMLTQAIQPAAPDARELLDIGVRTPASRPPASSSAWSSGS